MTFPPLDPLSWIPEATKREILDGLLKFMMDKAGKTLGDEFTGVLGKLRSDAAFQDAIDTGLKRATDRFLREYADEDEDLTAALSADRELWKAKSVRDALLAILRQPGRWEAQDWETIASRFDDVLPQRRNRERVDRAVRFFLRCLAEEVWHLPELKPIYEMQMQRISLDKAEAMVREVQGMRTDFQQTMLALVQGMAEQQKLLAGAARPALPEPPKVYHNLPTPDYIRFVGREAELAELRRLLAPDHRIGVISIDGIGGIGKSALALEVAHYYLREFNELPERERFQAIIWTSAKATVLTAHGIATRQQITRTLDDIYTTIAIALQREDITRARPEEQSELVCRALTRQRALLIVDNLETIDDERVNAFLRELPAPTKCIVTTRHRIDVAYPIRLAAMPENDALALIAQGCAEKRVAQTDNETDLLYRRTGGVPLAIVWSVAQMGLGHGSEAVLTRLGQPTDDVALFCFKEAIEHIQRKPAHKLLKALSLFATDASREALGQVAALPDLDRDDGLVELERLSLVNKRRDRFMLLPLTRTFVSHGLSLVEKAEEMRKWVNYLKELCKGADTEYYWRYKSYAFYDEGENILDAIEWCFDRGTADDIFVLVSAAYDYLEVTGRWAEILVVCRRALDLAQSVQNPIAIARLANIVGWVLLQRGDYSEAEALFWEALAQYRLAASREGESITLQHLSSVYRKQKDFDRAKRFNDQAWNIAEELGDGDLEALVNISYGKLERDLENWDEAWDYFTQVKDWCESRAEQTPRDEPLARSTWGHLAIVAYHLGRPQEAKELCLKSLEFFEELGTKGYMATLKYRLALAEEALREYDDALKHAAEAVDWFERLGMLPDYKEAIVLLERLQASSHTKA